MPIVPRVHGECRGDVGVRLMRERHLVMQTGLGGSVPSVHLRLQGMCRRDLQRRRRFVRQVRPGHVFDPAAGDVVRHLHQLRIRQHHAADGQGLNGVCDLRLARPAAAHSRGLRGRAAGSAGVLVGLRRRLSARQLQRGVFHRARVHRIELLDGGGSAGVSRRQRLLLQPDADQYPRNISRGLQPDLRRSARRVPCHTERLLFHAHELGAQDQPLRRLGVQRRLLLQRDGVPHAACVCGGIHLPARRGHGARGPVLHRCVCVRAVQPMPERVGAAGPVQPHRRHRVHQVRLR